MSAEIDEVSKIAVVLVSLVSEATTFYIKLKVINISGQCYFQALCYYWKTVAKTQSSTEFRNLIFSTNTFPYSFLNYLAKNIHLLNITKQGSTFRACKLISQLILLFVLICVLFTPTIW